MEYIENLLYMGRDNWLFTILIGTFSTILESFLPVLPLVAIVTANAAILGMGLGLLISWIGSSIGTALVFLFVNKFNDTKLVKNINGDKIDNISKWVKDKGFKLLFISYSCPFIPSSIITITCSLCKIKFNDFIVPMMCGKFIMFLVVSYVGSDLVGFIKSPIKVSIFLIMVFISWNIGMKINKRLDEKEEEYKKD